MDTAAEAQLQGLKILHLVRHAQGTHNVAAEENRDELMSYDHLDAPLSCLGRQQVCDLRKDVHERGLFQRIELVITSPMTRALQTAVGVFGRKDLADDELDEEQSTEDRDKTQNAISSTLNCIPILAVELCREMLGVQPCNKRRSISNYKSRFQAVDFSLAKSEDDNLWTADYRESNEEVAARGIKFFKWLWTRKEREIAVVSHGIFLQQTLMALGAKSYTPMPKDLLTRFRNCELRSISMSVTFVDEG
ncbi:hypothetical protein SLEP1_g42027 [Rubroshorea leprosula]|uniref:Phosphoglycerate mutase-like protein 1 n=1 Tax=Rubroshorea leprosula TaxID=152421 RepID=A0AAV5L8U2_9ROSI|nr:hypothetical protein SLEP1_g42027 [Rubroshorea leprosula]